MKFTLKGFTEFCKSKDPDKSYSYISRNCPVNQYCTYIGIPYVIETGRPISSDSAQKKAEWAASRAKKDFTFTWGRLVEKLESKCWIQKKEA